MIGLHRRRGYDVLAFAEAGATAAIGLELAPTAVERAQEFKASLSLPADLAERSSFQQGVPSPLYTATVVVLEPTHCFPRPPALPPAPPPAAVPAPASALVSGPSVTQYGREARLALPLPLPVPCSMR